MPDISTINTFEKKIDEYNHSEAVLFHAANVLILCDLSEKAISFTDQLLLKYPSSVDGYLVKGWLELKSNQLKNARNCFKAVLSQVRCITYINSFYLRCNIVLIMLIFVLEKRFNWSISWGSCNFRND